MRVQQQKLLIKEKSDDKRTRSHPEEKFQYNRHSTHLPDAVKSDSKC